MPKLTIGELEHDSEEVARKIEGDIAFLTARMRVLQSQPNLNTAVLKTYEDMLESRCAVLKWLRQEHLPDPQRQNA